MLDSYLMLLGGPRGIADGDAEAVGAEVAAARGD